REEAIGLWVALSVVQRTDVRLRGLSQRDGWPEMCTDPENGCVELQRAGEITEWLGDLVDRAPERSERLVREKGGTLGTTARHEGHDAEYRRNKTVDSSICCDGY